MNINAKHSLTVFASLGIAACLLTGTAVARGFGGGGGGGRMSSGSSGHFSGSSSAVHPMSNNMHMAPNSFSHPTNHFNGSNFTNRVNMSNKSLKFSSGFKSGAFKSSNQFKKPGFNKVANSKNNFWKKYNSWGKWNHGWGWGIGWGWGSWYSPWCNWYLYDPVPVVEYVNPYCACGGTVVDGTNYSMAIAQLPANKIQGDDSDAFAAAREAFLQGDLNTALQAISQAAAEMPQNRDVHQFHSLVLFAMKDYCKSATVAHAVLEDGPGWTWDTLQTCYPSPEIYTGQLRDLEQYVSANAGQPNVRFLLAYHYMMLNHGDSARRQMAQASELETKDKLAARIVEGISPPSANKPVAPPMPAPGPSPADNNAPSGTGPTIGVGPSTVTVPQGGVSDPQGTISDPQNNDPQSPMPIPPAPVSGTQASAAAVEPAVQPVASAVKGSPLVGTWKANPDKGVQIELALRENGTFDWKFTANGQSRNFSGKYQVGDKTLALARNGDGDAMEGKVEANGKSGFRFRMKDAEADDPGLTFTRS